MSDRSQALAEAWHAQAEWSVRASALKAGIGRRRHQLLALLAATAVAGAAAAMLAADPAHAAGARACALAAAALAALSAAVRQFGGELPAIERWTRARSIAEALKEAVFRHRSGTGLYGGSDADEQLRRATLRLQEQGRDLLDAAVPATHRQSEPPPRLDARGYVELRLNEQIEHYYRPQSESLLRQRDRWQRLQQGLLLAGALAGAASAYLPGAGLAPWVAVATTLAGAIGAHVEGSRFSHLVVAYRGTANRLIALRSRALDDLAQGRAVDLARLVDDGEDAISVENQAWMAAWSAKPPPPPTAAPQ